MRVKDLIRELQVHDPEAAVRTPDDLPVYVHSSEDRTVYLSDVAQTKQQCRQSTLDEANCYCRTCRQALFGKDWPAHE